MTTTLKPEEELALSHIFVLQEENLQGLSQYFKEELWQQLFDNIRSKYPHQPVPTAVHDLVNKVMNITYSEPSHHRCRNIIKTFLHDIKPATDSEEIMFKILRNLAENNTSSFSDDYNEDTFIHDIIEPVVKPFFANNRRTAMKWSNTTSISLAQMKKKFDPTLMGVRPDFIVHTINYNNYIELLIGEFKPPGTKVSLVNEDFVCLGKTMKYCLDKGIEDGMEDLVIGGLQVIGFLGHIYIMDLCFDGVYRMILLGEILFPEGIATWGTLIRCFQVLSLCVIGVVGVGYAFYWDYKRQNDPEFRRKIKRSKKRALKAKKAAEVDAKLKTADFVRKAVDEVSTESFPSDVNAKEKYFMEQVAKGESLLAAGENGYDEAALCFYKALKVYPSPVELIMIYQKTIPETIFNMVYEMMSLEVKKKQSEYFEKFPPKEMNVKVKDVNKSSDLEDQTRRGLFATKDFQPGETIFVELPLASALDPNLESGDFCSYCFKTISVGLEFTDGNDLFEAIYCSKLCMEKAMSEYATLLFTSTGSTGSDSKEAKLAELVKLGNVKYPLMIARFLARMVYEETQKVASGIEEEYTTWDHIERLRYLDVPATSKEEKEINLLKELFAAKVPGMEEFISEERYMVLKGKFTYNAYGNNSEPVRSSESPVIGACFYRFSSYIAHSCDPNVEAKFPNGDNTVSIVAKKHIKEGEELKISYIRQENRDVSSRISELDLYEERNKSSNNSERNEASDSDSSSGESSSGSSSARNSPDTPSALDLIYLDFLLQNKEQKIQNHDLDYSQVEKILKEKSNEEKLKEIFELDKPEKFKEDFRCNFIKSTMLQGFLFLTEFHICFHAYLPREPDVMLKDGNLTKLAPHGALNVRYYCLLQNDVFMYYNDPTDLYCPVEIIDLKYAIKVENLHKKNSFRIVTPKRKYKFQADSQISMEEWITQLGKSILRAKNEGDSVKIVIPIESIKHVRPNLSKNFPNTIQIVTYGDDQSGCDEFFFAFFSDSGTLIEELNDLRKPETSTIDNNDSQSSDSSISLASRYMSNIFRSVSINKRRKGYDDESSLTITKQTIKSPRSSTFENQTQDSKEGSLSITKQFQRRVKIMTTNPKEYISYFEENTSEKTNSHFREHFALPESEKLHAIFYGYFSRIIPVYGKFYISDNYICFRSRVVGKSTNLWLPISDIYGKPRKQQANVLGYHGLEILTKSQKEILIEFGFEKLRDRFFELIEERRLAIIKEGRSNSLGESDAETTKSTISELKPDHPLHFTLLTIGSRGDVQPYIALAKGLICEGHKVRIATHGEYKDWIESHGIEFGCVGGDPAELMRICVENGMFTFGFFKDGITNFREWFDELLKTSWLACQNTDVLIESPSAMSGIHIAEALGIPYFRAFTMPWTRTKAYPHAFAVSNYDLKGPYNYMSYVLIENAFWLAIAPQINRWRKNTLKLRSTSLEKMDANTVPFLYNFSDRIVPKAPDWADWIHVTGYWFLDNPEIGWKVPQDLIDFIKKNHDDKKKIVYIGFGSIVVDDPQAMTKIIVESIKRSGVAAILSKGWSDRLQRTKADDNKEEYPSCIYPLKSVPHDWLFPQVDAVVHHGGAGTTAAGLRAGKPTIIKPFFGDQFFWGERVEQMGIGFNLKKLTIEKLSDYLVAVTTDDKMIKKASLVGINIQKEDGLKNAIQAIYHDLDIAKKRIKEQKTRTENDSTYINTDFSTLATVKFFKRITTTPPSTP
ncbi:19753_t:CDS:10 [Entrophospora sp. SA101]|nr:19753_t:CDS:10 [Entrophospora sp. SA101]